MYPHRGIGIAGLAVLAAAVSTCARRPPQLPGPFAQVPEVLERIASPGELRALHRAAREGEGVFSAVLDTFWTRRDPTPGTPPNEYRMLIEARIQRAAGDLTPQGHTAPDDRLTAFALYGLPDRQNIMRLPYRTEQLTWLYHAPRGFSPTRYSEPLLWDRGYSIAFSRGRGGSYRFSRSGTGGWHPPEPLSPEEVDRLAAVLTDEGSSTGARVTAAWRLGIDPGEPSLAALLTSLPATGGDVRDMIRLAVQPLIPVRILAEEVMVAVEAPRDAYWAARLLPPEPGGRVARETPTAAPVEAESEAERKQRLSQELLTPFQPLEGLPWRAVQELRERSEEARVILESRGWLTPEEADSLYTGVLGEARRLVTSGDVLAAHALLAPLLKRDLREEPEAWHLDALALRDSAEPGGRRMAEDAVRQALRLAPGNLRYRLTLARILDQRTLAYYADDVLDDILAEAPVADAYALKGQIRLEAFWMLGWRAGGYGTSLSERPQTAGEQASEAVGLLQQALVLDPDNPFACWWLATHHVQARAWEGTVRVMTYLIQAGVHVPQAYLGRGMALQELGLLGPAREDYERGLDLLSPVVRPLARDPRWAIPLSEGGIGIRAKVSAIPAGSGGDAAEADSLTLRFWRSRDPLFATGENERLIEQYRRFAYVTWHFAMPDMGLQGWETHRGRVYLRYGHPLERDDDILNAQGPMGRPSFPDWGAENVAAPPRYDEDGNLLATLELPDNSRVWRYPGFEVDFLVGWVSGSWKVPAVGRVEELMEEVPERGDVVGDRPVRSLPVRVYTFEGPQGQAQVAAVARPALVPARTLRTRERPEPTDVPAHLILLDEAWEPVRHFRLTVPRAWSAALAARLWTTGVLDLGEEAGYACFASLELLPSGEYPRLAGRDTLDLAPADDGVRLSSLVLAERLTDARRYASVPEGSFLEREGRAIFPRPEHRFVGEEPIYLYFEAYGLARDEINATRYETSLTVTTLHQERRPVISLLAEVLRRVETASSVTIVTRHDGIGDRAAEVLRVVFPEEEGDEGTYRITLRITDLVAGSKAERSAVIRVMRP